MCRLQRFGVAGQLAHRDADIAKIAVDEQAAAGRGGSAELRGQRVAPDRHRLAAACRHGPHARGIERRAGFAGERGDQHDHVDLVGAGEMFHHRHHRRAGVRSLRGDIDRIAGCAVGRHQRAQGRLRFRRQVGHDQAVRRQRVGHPGAAAAGDGDDAGAAAFRQRAGQHQAGDGDRFVGILGFDDAVTFEHRVIGGVGSGQRRGVRRAGAGAGVGPADLDGDDRLAQALRAFSRAATKPGPLRTVSQNSITASV